MSSAVLADHNWTDLLERDLRRETYARTSLRRGVAEFSPADDRVVASRCPACNCRMHSPRGLYWAIDAHLDSLTQSEKFDHYMVLAMTGKERAACRA